MSVRAALPDVHSRPQRLPASLLEWMRVVNKLAAGAGRGHTDSAPSRRPAGPAALLLTTDARPAGGSSRSARSTGLSGYRMAPEVAERLVAEGMAPDYLNDLAAASGLEAQDVLGFAGIDRTTVSRRKASGSALPHDAAVKALQATELMTQATEVFGTPALASTWLTRPHPALAGATPLRRARTPWGMSKVQSILVGLRYGGAA